MKQSESKQLNQVMKTNHYGLDTLFYTEVIIICNLKNDQ